LITAAETKLRINEDLKWWKIPLMDFVDDFRRNKNPAAIRERFVMDNEQIDAVLASVIESLCDEMKIEIPAWLESIPACRQPYFVAGIEDLKATAIVESPVRFRLRKVFVMENFLQRV